MMMCDQLCEVKLSQAQTNGSHLQNRRKAGSDACITSLEDNDPSMFASINTKADAWSE